MNKVLLQTLQTNENRGASPLIKELETILVITDLQEKLIKAIQNKQEIISNIYYLSKACDILNIKIICTEQMPEKLGLTIDTAINKKDLVKFSKESFSSCQNRDFVSFLKKNNTKNIILCGIETHICIQQTALDLISKGYNIYLAADAIASRDKFDHDISLKRMAQEGVIVSTIESIIFELCKNCSRIEFKEISTLIKDRMSRKNTST